MTEMQAIAAIVLSFAVPFAVQLIKTEAMTGKARASWRWAARSWRAS